MYLYLYLHLYTGDYAQHYALISVTVPRILQLQAANLISCDLV